MTFRFGRAITERLKGFVYVLGGQEWEIYTGLKFRKIENEIRQKDNKIFGTVAYSGKAQGKVKKFLSTYKTSVIPGGFIFVTGMTNPQMFPFLKKVKAIITDEGGLTCHAAIIARELKIPCIVGTGNATEALNDGDFVKVDAEKGIVQKIN